VPLGSRESKNIPDDVRQFIQAQLKGQTRIGQPQAYLAADPQGEVFDQYQQGLVAGGWDSVPVGTNLGDRVKLLVAQKDTLRAVVAFVDEGNGQTLVYIITTKR
jgi:hypothetical protein